MEEVRPKRTCQGGETFDCDEYLESSDMFTPTFASTPELSSGRTSAPDTPANANFPTSDSLTETRGGDGASQGQDTSEPASHDPGDQLHIVETEVSETELEETEPVKAERGEVKFTEEVPVFLDLSTVQAEAHDHGKHAGTGEASEETKDGNQYRELSPIREEESSPSLDQAALGRGPLDYTSEEQAALDQETLDYEGRDQAGLAHMYKEALEQAAFHAMNDSDPSPRDKTGKSIERDSPSFRQLESQGLEQTVPPEITRLSSQRLRRIQSWLLNKVSPESSIHISDLPPCPRFARLRARLRRFCGNLRRETLSDVQQEGQELATLDREEAQVARKYGPRPKLGFRTKARKWFKRKKTDAWGAGGVEADNHEDTLLEVGYPSSDALERPLLNSLSML